MKNEFSQYQLSSEVLEALTLLKYEKPTPIQQEVIPVAQAGKNIVARSQTGTGKTAAFAIPICEQVTWEGNLPQALILEPTRELSVQVQEEIFHIGRKKRLKVPAVFGGFPIDKQIRTLKQKSHIVVGTPGRIMDHIRRDSLKLQEIKFLVIDEADLMLDMGFLEEVKQIMDLLPEKKQTMLFSATLENSIKKLAEETLSDAVSIIIDSQTEAEPDIEEYAYEVDAENKYDMFIRLLIQENPESCMIFCGTREMVNVLYHKLKKDRISCGMIHGELDQSERLKTIDAFRSERFRYLIATDVAARGIDFEGITHVVNYDFPTGRETYVHRIGRTGRNGKSGTAISLFSEQEQRMKQMVESYMERTIPVAICKENDSSSEKRFRTRQKERTASKERKGAALNRHITRLSIGGGKRSKMRAVDIVGTVCNIPGVESSDIGIIDIRDSLTYVEILNGKGSLVLEALQTKAVKGKIRKVRVTRNVS